MNSTQSRIQGNELRQLRPEATSVALLHGDGLWKELVGAPANWSNGRAARTGTVKIKVG